MGDQLSAGINRCVKFRWVDNVSLTLTRLLRIRSQVVSVLEVDLEYPEHLYDEHVDLSFCPMRHKPPSKQQVKLLATVYDKKRYVILYLFILCYRNLQQRMRHGLRIIKIHRVLQFAQSLWLRNYIELNTKFRTFAKNDFEKNLFKLMNNAVFGKTMENVRNYIGVKLLTQWMIRRKGNDREVEFSQQKCIFWKSDSNWNS